MKKGYLVVGVLFAIDVAVTAAFVALMPDQVPVHFTGGEVDRIGSRYETFTVVALAFVFGLFLMLLARFGEQENRATMMKLNVGMQAMFIAVSVFVSLNTLSYDPTAVAAGTPDSGMSKIAAVIVGATLLFLGNLMPKTTRNAAFGIRLPWTQSSEGLAKGSAVRRVRVHSRRHPHDRLRHPLRRRGCVRRRHRHLRRLDPRQHHRFVLRLQGCAGLRRRPKRCDEALFQWSGCVSSHAMRKVRTYRGAAGFRTVITLMLHVGGFWNELVHEAKNATWAYDLQMPQSDVRQPAAASQAQHLGDYCTFSDHPHDGARGRTTPATPERGSAHVRGLRTRPAHEDPRSLNV